MRTLVWLGRRGQVSEQWLMGVEGTGSPVLAQQGRSLSPHPEDWSPRAISSPPHALTFLNAGNKEECDLGQLFEIQILVSINKVVLEDSPFVYILFMVVFML